MIVVAVVVVMAVPVVNVVVVLLSVVVVLVVVEVVCVIVAVVTAVMVVFVSLLCFFIATPLCCAAVSQDQKTGLFNLKDAALDRMFRYLADVCGDRPCDPGRQFLSPTAEACGGAVGCALHLQLRPSDVDRLDAQLCGDGYGVSVAVDKPINTKRPRLPKLAAGAVLLCCALALGMYSTPIAVYNKELQRSTSPPEADGHPWVGSDLGLGGGSDGGSDGGSLAEPATPASGSYSSGAGGTGGDDDMTSSWNVNIEHTVGGGRPMGGGHSSSSAAEVVSEGQYIMAVVVVAIAAVVMVVTLAWVLHRWRRSRRPAVFASPIAQPPQMV